MAQCTRERVRSFVPQSNIANSSNNQYTTAINEWYEAHAAWIHRPLWSRNRSGFLGLSSGRRGTILTVIDTIIEEWMTKQIAEELNPRRRELLKKGLGHGTLEFLKTIWYPTLGSLDHLYPEWEVRALNNSYPISILRICRQERKGA